MTGSSHKRDPHGGADPYSKLSHAQDRRRRTIPMVIGGTVMAGQAFTVTAQAQDGGGITTLGLGMGLPLPVPE